MTNYTKIKRTLQALQYAYPCQTITKETVLNCLGNADFQSKYINY